MQRMTDAAQWMERFFGPGLVEWQPLLFWLAWLLGLVVFDRYIRASPPRLLQRKWSLFTVGGVFKFGTLVAWVMLFGNLLYTPCKLEHFEGGSIPCFLHLPGDDGLLQNYVISVYWTCITFLLGFTHRQYLKGFIAYFLSPVRTRVRLPWMTAAAPILLGHERDVWKSRNLDVEVDWRYAGHDALADLVARDSEIHVAVASDLAVRGFIASRVRTGESAKITVIPFAAIRGNIKIVVRKPANVSPNVPLSDPQKQEVLSKVRLLCKQGTASEAFVDRFGLGAQKQFGSGSTLFADIADLLKAPALTSMSAGASQQDPSAGLVLWEPVYQGFEGNDEFRVLEPPNATLDPMRWSLCAVLRNDWVSERPRIAEAFFEGLQEACKICNQTRANKAILEICADYLPKDFVGIDQEGLDQVWGADKSHKPSFDLEAAYEAAKRTFDDGGIELRLYLPKNWSSTPRVYRQ